MKIFKIYCIRIYTLNCYKIIAYILKLFSAMEQLTKITRFELYELCRSRTKTIEFLWQLNLLQNNPICTICNRPYELKQTLDNADGCRWKCNGRACGKSTMSIRNNSFFAHSRLRLQDLVFLLYEWTRETTVTEVCFQYGFDEHTVIDWFRFYRDICTEKLCNFNNGEKIGGQGTIVEIDETCVSRRKYQVGRIVPTVWMVGGIVRSEEFKMFLEIVPNRSAQTFKKVIGRNVEVGTTIVTDKWGGYINLERYEFIHKK